MSSSGGGEQTLPVAAKRRELKKPLYENSELFLRQASNPFDGSFEEDISKAPVLPIRRQNSVSSESNSATTTPSSGPNSPARLKPYSKKSSYDEMTINAGKPVIVTPTTPDQDLLTAVSFGSPLKDLEKPRARPVPAPRFSKQSKIPESEDPPYMEVSDAVTGETSTDEPLYEELIPKRFDNLDLNGARPTVPPRNKTSSHSSSEQQSDCPLSRPGSREENHSSGTEETTTKHDNLYSELEPPPIGDTAQSEKTESEGTSNAVPNLLEAEDDEMGEDIDDAMSPLREGDDGERKRLLNPKLTTIDIRKDVNKLWEKAVEELDRDETLVEFLEQKEGGGSSRNSSIRRTSEGNKHSYDSVAIPEQRFKIVNGVQVPIPVTLLKTFDPCFDDFKDEGESENESSDEEEHESSVQDDSKDTSRRSSEDFDLSEPPSIPPPTLPLSSGATSLETNEDIDRQKRSSSEVSSAATSVRENVYVSHSRTQSSTNSSSSDLRASAPRPYENIWIPEGGTPEMENPPQRPNRSSHRSSSVRSHEHSVVEGAQALESPSAEKSTMSFDDQDRVSVGSASKYSTNSSESCNPEVLQRATPPHLKNVQRSSSTSNLAFIAKKFSFSKIGRKFSDTVTKPPKLEGVVPEDREMAMPARRRSSNLSEGSWPATRNHSGPLSVHAKSKKGGMQEKWCVLGNANLRYFNHKDSMAEPKELILLKDILSLYKRTDEETVEGEAVTLFCFDIAFVSSQEKSSKSKLHIRTFCSHSQPVRDVWVDKIVQSLSHKLSSFTMDDCCKLGWVYLKAMFAGEWSMSWICIRGESTFMYTSKEDEEPECVNLKKTKNITLVREIKNLNALEPSVPVLVVDFIDRSLYLQSKSEKESIHWKETLERLAFGNGNQLDQQQVTKDDIPVIVEQCVNFVFRHGCMTEGIYRHSGVKTKIDRLLAEFTQNAWAVAMTREEFSEHDVANALKRFMRTLEEPLLTAKLRAQWMAVSKIQSNEVKLAKYVELLNLLPDINRKTLRRICGHLRTVANTCDRNLMPNYNLAAIWGPTLLTVDGQKAMNFAQTSGEADVCRDLIDHYNELFNVTQEELQREEEIMRKTENFNRNPNPVKLSGEVMMFVYIDTKTSGECVSVAVAPKMTANELQKRALRKANYDGDTSSFVLHEVILGGEMERPIHYNELIYDVTLKWWQWPEEDRRNTYLLLKPNSFLQEALPCAIPPLSVFGEALYADSGKSSKTQFKKCQFSMSNARLTRSRETKGGNTQEIESWEIERIIWYFGCEARRQAPSNLSVTFIEKEAEVVRTKDRPFFGKTISFASRELFIKWVAAMLVAEHQSDIMPPETLLNIDED